MAHASVSLQKLLTAHRKNSIQVFCPVFHGHDPFPFRLALRKIQIPGNKLTHCAKLLFVQVVLCYHRLFQRGLFSGKCGQSHKFLFSICSRINNLSRCLTMNGIVDLILDFPEKLNRNLCMGIVVDASGVNFQNLSVKNLFRGTDVSDAFQQFLEVSAAAQIFQALIIQGKPFSHILFQNPGCPDTELCATFGLYTITDRDNHIQIVIFNLIGFPVRSSCCKFCNN